MKSADEIEQAKHSRWPEADSDLAELGLIAEALGIDVGGGPWKPRLESGAVLEAVRDRIGGKA